MAELACDTSSEESLNPQESQKAGPSAPPKEKKPRCSSHSRCVRRRGHCRYQDSFATYFPKMLNQVHSGLSLSQATVSILDSFVKDMLDRIASEARRLARQNNRVTITSREIQTAVRLLLPGEIGKHAVSEATRAVRKSHHRK
ncbi:Histone H2B type W-T [Sciurus carolinensis]|uniref:Histone H2B type W-T n=1 Tax=Sciurus carolinensis TaxID=30640 RepID=A0AA41MUA1_SCICA|nr:late histone H2B.L4-like [Sciurus carolinensis]MBZ3877974.1 Histone H2B type W-T [Sciurus carolinensis]